MMCAWCVYIYIYIYIYIHTHVNIYIYIYSVAMTCNTCWHSLGQSQYPALWHMMLRSLWSITPIVRSSESSKHGGRKLKAASLDGDSAPLLLLWMGLRFRYLSVEHLVVTVRGEGMLELLSMFQPWLVTLIHIRRTCNEGRVHGTLLWNRKLPLRDQGLAQRIKILASQACPTTAIRADLLHNWLFRRLLRQPYLKLISFMLADYFEPNFKCTLFMMDE